MDGGLLTFIYVQRTAGFHAHTRRQKYKRSQMTAKQMHGMSNGKDLA